MSTPSTWTTSGPLAGNGSNTSFAYGQQLQSVNDLQVYLTDPYNNITNLVSGTDYLVNIGSQTSAGGTITYPISGSPLPASWYITLNLAVPLTNAFNISTLTTSTGPVIQQAVDRGTLQCLTLQQEINEINTTLSTGPVTSVNGQTGTVTISLASLYGAPINSPTFTGTVTIPLGASISGYLTTASASATYLTQSNASSTYAPISSISGTAGQVAVFTGTNATASYSQLSYTNSASSPGLTLYGTLYPTYTVANSTGSVSAEFSANSVFALVGSYSNHPFCIRTNNTNRFNFLANGNAYYSTQTLTAGSTVTWDASTGNDFILTPNQTCTINVTNPQAGAWYILTLTASSSSYTITFGTNIKSTGTLATGTVAGKQFVLLYRSDGTNLIEMSRTAAL